VIYCAAKCHFWMISKSLRCEEPKTKSNSDTLFLTLILYNSVERSLWKASSSSVIEDIPNISWNPRVHFRVHDSSPLVPVLGRIIPVHAVPSYFCQIHFSIILPSTPWSSSSLCPSGFPTRTMRTFHLSPIRATCSASHIFFDLVCRLLFHDEYKSLNPFIMQLSSILSFPLF
jgi:hypothetical protein